jgi:hypothetical protein
MLRTFRERVRETKEQADHSPKGKSSRSEKRGRDRKGIHWGRRANCGAWLLLKTMFSMTLEGSVRSS